MDRNFRAVPCLARVCPVCLSFRSIASFFLFNSDLVCLRHNARLDDTPPHCVCVYRDIYSETLPVDFGVAMGGTSKAGYESVFEDHHPAEGPGRESGESLTPCPVVLSLLMDHGWIVARVCGYRPCCSRRKAWKAWRTSIRLWSVLRVYGESSQLRVPSSILSPTQQLNNRYEGNPYAPLSFPLPPPSSISSSSLSLPFTPPRCNRHLLALGQRIKASLTKSDIIGYQFGTVGVSDGISMGTRGMSFSLQSRDLIADQVESAAGGHWLDGMVVVPGCDKNMPGVLMARTYLPSLLLYMTFDTV